MVYEQNETLWKNVQTILPSHPPSVCVGVFHSAAECPEWVLIRFIPIPVSLCQSPRGISFRRGVGYNWVHSHPPSVCVGLTLTAKTFRLFSLPIPRQFVCESPGGISFRSGVGYNWVHSHPPSVCVGLTLTVKTFRLFSLPIPRQFVCVSPRGIFLMMNVTF